MPPEFPGGVAATRKPAGLNFKIVLRYLFPCAEFLPVIFDKPH
jgi:hypothetical protein